MERVGMIGICGGVAVSTYPKLLLGDCLSVLRTMPVGTVDSFVTDPPYGIGYRTRKGKSILNDNAPFIWWLYDAYRVTREGGALICFCRWDVQDAFRWAITLAGWEVKSQVVWDRGVHGMGDTKAAFAPRHDIIWFAVKGKFQFPGKRPASVVCEQRILSGLVHPTEKPVDLMGRLVEAVTPAGGVVMDPCMGSGATGVAAVQKGYRFIGCELDAEHYSTAQSRILACVSGGR